MKLSLRDSTLYTVELSLQKWLTCNMIKKMYTCTVTYIQNLYSTLEVAVEVTGYKCIFLYYYIIIFPPHLPMGGRGGDSYPELRSLHKLSLKKVYLRKAQKIKQSYRIILLSQYQKNNDNHYDDDDDNWWQWGLSLGWWWQWGLSLGWCWQWGLSLGWCWQDNEDYH